MVRICLLAASSVVLGFWGAKIRRLYLKTGNGSWLRLVGIVVGCYNLGGISFTLVVMEPRRFF